MNTIILNYYNQGTAEGRIDFDGEEYQFKFEVEDLEENTGDFVSLVECDTEKWWGVEDVWTEVGSIKQSRILPQIIKELQPKLSELIEQSIQDDVDRVYEQEKDRRMMLDRRESARQNMASGKVQK